LHRRLALTAQSLAGATIAFDLDGTLVDTAPDLIGTLNVILRREGIAALDIAAARDIIGRGARAMIKRGFEAAGATLDEARVSPLFEDFIEIYLGRIAEESRPFDGLIAALDVMEAEGARFVVCTNKRTDLSLALLDALDLTRRFAAVCGADLPPAMKPDARHVLHAIGMAGGDPARAVMVGDSASDANAGKAAAVPVVLVSFGYTDIPVDQLHRDALIDHFDQLPGVVRTLLAAPH
jgi:phosphoglycolate phosphatase